VGGWESSKTQGTKLTPAVAKLSIIAFEKFILRFNKFLKQNQLDPIGKMIPVGSTSYVKQDLDNNIDKIYGDVDMMVEIPIAVEQKDDFRKEENKIRRQYNDAFKQFIKSGSVKNVEVNDTLHTNAKSIIFNLNNNMFAQVDLIWTFKPYVEWMTGRYKPEYGFKGFNIGNLYSALGAVLTLSFGTEGVLARFKDDILVTGNKRKGVIYKLISTDIGKFMLHATKFLIKINDPSIDIKKIIIDPLLKKHKGINTDNVSIKDFCLGIKGMANTLQANGVLGHKGLSNIKDTKDFITKVRAEYAKRMRSQSSLKNPKYAKANSPEASQMIKDTRRNALDAMKIVSKFLK
jgi:hypothetical protein